LSRKQFNHEKLLTSLHTRAPARDREIEAENAKVDVAVRARCVMHLTVRRLR
jgi:hypothetical protein